VAEDVESDEEVSTVLLLFKGFFFLLIILVVVVGLIVMLVLQLFAFMHIRRRVIMVQHSAWVLINIDRVLVVVVVVLRTIVRGLVVVVPIVVLGRVRVGTIVPIVVLRRRVVVTVLGRRLRLGVHAFIVLDLDQSISLSDKVAPSTDSSHNHEEDHSQRNLE
jgi:hypothetical protein